MLSKAIRNNPTPAALIALPIPLTPSPVDLDVSSMLFNPAAVCSLPCSTTLVKSLIPSVKLSTFFSAFLVSTSNSTCTCSAILLHF